MFFVKLGIMKTKAAPPFLRDSILLLYGNEKFHPMVKGRSTSVNSTSIILALLKLILGEQ